MERVTPKSNKRKRATKVATPDDSDDSRKRGRPRVEKPDESAADRRRTQIRMAQRAYRKRKESTMDELRKRVSELSNITELMNKAFNDCYERLLPSLSGQTSNDLMETVAYCNELVRSSRNTDEEGSADASSFYHDTLPVAEKGAPAILWADHATPAWIAQSTKGQRASPNAFTHIGMGYYNVNSGAAPHNYTEDVGIAEIPGMVPSDPMLEQGGYDMYKAAKVLEFVDQIPNEMNPIRTFSFNETSFGRRLHRAALESAYQLLLDPVRRSSSYSRTFKLSLLTRDLPKLSASIKQSLNAGVRDEMDCWSAPLLHVGGAGTHYQRKDPYGNLLPKKQSFHLGLVGPQTLALLDSAAKENTSADMTVEIAGFEGTWFDPYDVEGYLEEKGIRIDPHSSFAEAKLVDWPAGKDQGSTDTSVTTPKTPVGEYSTDDRTLPLSLEQMESLNRVGADPSQWNDLTDISGAGYADALTEPWTSIFKPEETVTEHHPGLAGGDWHASSTGYVIESRATPILGPSETPQATRKSVIIDVAKFVKVLSVCGACLGRVPGYKKRDVDRALAISSFEAY